jgi:hypothetical protein
MLEGFDRRIALTVDTGKVNGCHDWCYGNRG